MRFSLWGQNLDGWHISWVAIPEHVGWCELLDRCLRHVGVETEEGICSDGQCLHLLKPASRILEWVAISSSRGSSQPGDQTLVSYVSCIGWQILYHHLGSQSTKKRNKLCITCKKVLCAEESTGGVH